MANTPTYMIFDDHEITDDWNITRDWVNNVRRSHCGKQVISNGLAAYWAFQGWGNDPAAFSDDFVHRIVDYFGKNGNVQDDERKSFEDFIWSFHGWNYAVPTDPIVVVADTRTQRQYDSPDGPPQLISNEGLLSIFKVAGNANFKKGDPIIIVSATPVLGFLLLEAIQKALAIMTSIYALDLESWYANTRGRINFLTFLAEKLAPMHCIFLSGDVHFGFTIRAAFARLHDGGASREMMSITQLTSSAIKTTSLVKIAFISEIMGRIRQLFPLKRLVRKGSLNGGEEQLKRFPDWVEAREMVKASGSLVPLLLISDNNLGSVAIKENTSVIIHKLLVRKETTEIMVHESVVTTSSGRSPLEDNVSLAIHEMGIE